MQEQTGKFVFNEINTLPGLAPTGMFSNLWKYEEITEKIWIEELISHAYSRNQLLKKKQYGIRASL